MLMSLWATILKEKTYTTERLYPYIRDHAFTAYTRIAESYVCTVHTLSGDVMFRGMGAKFVRYASLYFSAVIKIPNVRRILQSFPSYVISFFFYYFLRSLSLSLSLTFKRNHTYTRAHIHIDTHAHTLSLTRILLSVLHARTLIRHHYTTTPYTNMWSTLKTAIS